MGRIAKNIAVAIELEKEYIHRKVDLLENVDILNFLRIGGYYNLEKYVEDKKLYYISKIADNLKLQQITCESGDATIMQPNAYSNYINMQPFCYFVEHDSLMGLLPFESEYSKTLEENNIDCFYPGQSEGGVIISLPDDFNFALFVLRSDVPEINVNYFIQKLCNFLNQYYDGEIIIDGNDLMYNSTKIAGNVSSITGNAFMFASHVSLVDSKDIIDSIGLPYKKVPGSLPLVDNLKNLLKNEVQSWLH